MSSGDLKETVTSVALPTGSRAPWLLLVAIGVALFAPLVWTLVSHPRQLVDEPTVGVIIGAGVGAIFAGFGMLMLANRNVAARDVPRIARDIRREMFDVVVFTSPSTALRLLEGAAAEGIEIRDAMRVTKVVAIGEVTASAVAQAGLPIHAVAARPSDDAIVEAVSGLFGSLC